MIGCSKSCFTDFLWIFFPNKAERLNFATLRFLDKELIVNFAGQELRITDLIADVETWKGTAAAIILHVEIEGRDKYALPQRMSEYYVLLRLLTLLFGEVPAYLVERINTITDEAVLATLAQQILTIKRIEDLVIPVDERE